MNVLIIGLKNALALQIAHSLLLQNPMTKITFVNVNNSTIDESSHALRVVNERDIASSLGILRKSDLNERRDIAITRRLREQFDKRALREFGGRACCSALGKTYAHEVRVNHRNENKFDADFEREVKKCDCLLFCDGAGPLSLACAMNERMLKLESVVSNRPAFLFVSLNGTSEHGTIFVDDGSEKAKTMYDALRPQFTVLFALGIDDNDDTDEKKRRERRAALHWEFLKRTPEAKPLLNAVNERSNEKNRDTFLVSSSPATTDNSNNSNNSNNRSTTTTTKSNDDDDDENEDVFLPMTMLVASTAAFAVTKIWKRREENIAKISTAIKIEDIETDKKESRGERGMDDEEVLEGANQWIHLDIFDCLKNVEKNNDDDDKNEINNIEEGYETITTQGIDSAMDDDPKEAVLKHIGFDAVENIRKRCKIAIVGSGILSASLATSFAAIGVSEIALVGDASDPQNINFPKAAQHPLLCAYAGDPMFSLSECENDANALALNERFPDTKSYYYYSNENNFDNKNEDNDVSCKFDIIVHVQEEAPFSKERKNFPQIQASFAIRCGVVGKNQIGIVEVNKRDSPYAWTKCTDSSLAQLVSSTVALEIIRWAKGGRRKERLIYVDSRGRGCDAL